MPRSTYFASIKPIIGYENWQIRAVAVIGQILTPIKQEFAAGELCCGLASCSRRDPPSPSFLAQCQFNNRPTTPRGVSAGALRKSARSDKARCGAARFASARFAACT
jgi:hypothetical protein